MPQTPGTNQWVVSSALDFQTALNAVETNSTLNTIVITRDIITPGSISGYSLPKKIAHPSGKLIIQGNNSTISAKVSQSAPLLSRTLSNTSALGDLNNQIVINDLNFNGTNAGGTFTSTLEGLRIEGASDVIVNNCNFNSLGKGVILGCVQTGYVSNCIVKDIYSIGYTTTSTVSWNSAAPFDLLSTYSRNITFNKCTSDLKENGLYGFLIEKTANVVLNDCIGTSAGTIVHHVLFDSQGGISNSIYPSGGDELINNFNIYNITINTPIKREPDTCGNAPGGLYLGSLIRIKAAGSTNASGSYAKIDGLHLHPNVSNSLVINASSAKGFNDLYVYNVPYLNAGSEFATDGGIILANANCAVPPDAGTIWEFKETFDAANIFSSTRWYNDVIPFYRLSDNFSFSSRSKNYLTNFMRINNKTVSQ